MTAPTVNLDAFALTHQVLFVRIDQSLPVDAHTSLEEVAFGAAEHSDFEEFLDGCGTRVRCEGDVR